MRVVNEGEGIQPFIGEAVTEFRKTYHYGVWDFCPAEKEINLHKRAVFCRAKDGFIFVEFGRVITNYPTG